MPWLIGEAVPHDRDDLYTTPGVTREKDTLYTHCLRALTSVRLGPRGLPLMNGGDWNDGMNRVRGESVWLALFYMVTLKEFARLAPQDVREEILSDHARLGEAVEQYGWDGEWYLRAWFDDGTPLGSAASPECRIDSLSQSWAVLALGVTERTSRAMEQAWQQLFDPRSDVMRLLTPPFDGVLDAGYISGYLPGIRENGGQYTHAAAWMLLALCELGWTDRAYTLLRALNPILRGGSPEGMLRYRVEPYALAADVYANPLQQGRGGWSHYTGSAAWLYTVVLEKLLKLPRFEKYPSDEDLLEDVIIENKQAIEMANIYSGILEGMMNAFSSVISNNLNQVIKILAAVTIVLSIPTMVSSFYGMNVNVAGMPFSGSTDGFLIIIIFSLILSLIVALILKIKHMF